MLDYSSEHVIPVSDVPKHVPGRPSLRTVWRWTEKGASRRQTRDPSGRRPASHFLGSDPSFSHRHQLPQDPIRVTFCASPTSDRAGGI